MTSEALGAYLNLMADILRRSDVIDAIASKQTGLVYRITTWESIYLQFRKILEHIAFASLVANKTAYAEAYDDYSRHWNAKRLLGKLAKINPLFYPQPKTRISGKGHVWEDWIDRTDDFLTKEDFVTLYNMCGNIIHTKNPYGAALNLSAYETGFAVWRTKIISLLNTHVIQLSGDPKLYMILMKTEAGSDTYVEWVQA